MLTRRRRSVRLPLALIRKLRWFAPPMICTRLASPVAAVADGLLPSMVSVEETAMGLCRSITKRPAKRIVPLLQTLGTALRSEPAPESLALVTTIAAVQPRVLTGRVVRVSGRGNSSGGEQCAG